MKTEHERLIGCLFEDELLTAARERAIEAGRHASRRRRFAHQLSRGVGVVMVVAGVLLTRSALRPPHADPPSMAAAKPASISILTDEELLKLFPDTPVALADLGGGKKKLIFPRPGDEERWIVRLSSK